MFDLDRHSTAKEIRAYAALCLEFEIKTVFVDRDVYDLIQQIERSRIAEFILLGIQFILRTEVEPEYFFESKNIEMSV